MFCARRDVNTIAINAIVTSFVFINDVGKKYTLPTHEV